MFSGVKCEKVLSAIKQRADRTVSHSSLVYADSSNSVFSPFFFFFFILQKPDVFRDLGLVYFTIY